MSAWDIPLMAILALMAIPFVNAAFNLYRNRNIWVMITDLVINFYSLFPMVLFLMIGNVQDLPVDLWLLWCVITNWLLVFKMPLFQKIFRGLQEIDEKN